MKLNSFSRLQGLLWNTRICFTKRAVVDYVRKPYQCLDGPQWLKQARQQLSPPLIGQETQAGFCESLLRHAQLPLHRKGESSNTRRKKLQSLVRI